MQSFKMVSREAIIQIFVNGDNLIFKTKLWQAKLISE